jgi:hypothetical protein
LVVVSGLNIAQQVHDNFLVTSLAVCIICLLICNCLKKEMVNIYKCRGYHN